ncbi:MAG: amidinotransferase [Gemmatimonadetes bacterium]|nr:amidinotransferase [Gemmatimonadota bacterium]
MLLALTRSVSPAMAHCELTHLARVPIDPAVAASQHRGYERALEQLGCRVQHVAPAPGLPDSVFVEDTAVVLDEVAVIARPGAESRRAEVDAVADALGRYRPLVTIQAPGTLDGGDVLRVGRSLYVGQSGRTNDEGIEQLRRHAARHGYEVRPVRPTGCLHLKTAVTAVSEHGVLLNPEWIAPALFDEFQVMTVDPAEPFAANVVRVGRALLTAAAFPRTRRIMEERGLEVHVVDVSELAKAEGAVTCCSILLEA